MCWVVTCPQCGAPLHPQEPRPGHDDGPVRCIRGCDHPRLLEKPVTEAGFYRFFEIAEVA